VSVTAEAACQVCGDSLDGATPETTCPACETPHHLDCWNFAEGCAVYGCPGSLALARQEAVERVLEEVPGHEGGDGAHVVDIELPELQVPPEALRAIGRQGSGIPTPVWFVIGLFAVAFFLGRLAFEARTGTVFVGELVGMMLGGLLMAASPFLPRAFLDLEHYGEELQVDETSRKQLEARLGEAPDNVYLLEALALERLAEGDGDGAIELLERVVELQPANLQALIHLGRAWFERGDRPRALELFQRAESLATTEAQRLRTKRWQRMATWVDVRAPEA
jgi:hypothetical protein